MALDISIIFNIVKAEISLNSFGVTQGPSSTVVEVMILQKWLKKDNI